MPLVGGYTQKAISERIRQLIREGYEPQQAKAISYSKAREAAKKIKDPQKRAAVLRRLSKGKKGD